MNIAFTALLALFLALPGLILCYAYRNEYGRPAWSGSLTDEIPLGLALATVLHAFWILLLSLLGRIFSWPVYVDLESALILLAAHTGKAFDEASHSITHHPLCVFLYFLTICAFAALLGRYGKRAVRRYGWDKKLTILRWNDWYYLLNGESPDDSVNPEDIDGWRVTAVVGDYVYWGVLVDYVIGRSGELDSLVLVDPHRRLVGAGETPEDDLKDEPRRGTHPINATYLVLKYSECTNLALLGIKLNAGPASQ